jgi:protein-S-isoprenylcysteine O-methyltransferase Ste14
VLKTLSKTGYLVMIGGLAGLIFMRSILSPSPIVIAVQVAALALITWARVTFGRRSFHVSADPTEGRLVTNGPYHYIRNPIYAAVCLFSWAGIAAHLSFASVGCGLLILGSTLVRISCEETLLKAHFPDYAQYAANTPRLIPFVY